MMKHTMKYLAALACLLMSIACGSTEEPIETPPVTPTGPTEEAAKSVVSVDIPLSEGTTTRGHWDANGEKFFWDKDEPLLTVVKHGTEYVPFYDAETSAQRNYYSLTNITVNTQDAGKARFNTVDGILVVKEGDKVTFPVAVGDPVYNLSPVDINHVSAAANRVTATMPIASSFSQSTKNDMNGLKDYAYIYAKTEMSEVTESNLLAKATTFDAGVALVRFTLLSSIEGNKVKRITMSADEDKRIFPNTATWTAGTEAPIAVSDDNSNFYSSITTTIGGDEGDVLVQDENQHYFQFLLPCSESLTNDCVLTFTIETSLINYTYSVSTETFFGQSKTNTKTFEAGKIFTFGFKLGQDIQLTSVTFSTWGETVFDIDSELVSEVINPEVSSWNETLQPAALMEFIDLGLTKTVDGKSYKVLWAACNLGSLTPLGEGGYYAWGASNTAADPVQIAYGLSGYNWMTPTKEDFEQLIAVAHEFGTYTTEGNTAQGEDVQGVAAWKFSANNQTLYIPVTGYKIDGNEYKVQGVCHYWSGSGTTAAPLGFVTNYQGNEASLPSALTPFTDSRLMAIRPIYLKPIK